MIKRKPSENFTEGVEDEPTLGDLNPALAEPSLEPALEPNFMVGDEPPPLPRFAEGFAPMPSVDPAGDAERWQPRCYPSSRFPQALQAPKIHHGEILPQPGMRFESRITILEAFRYDGSFRLAPGWVDRNWLAYADPDPLRGIEAGPALRVPLPSGAHVIARIGDYVCQQEIRFTDSPAEIRVEVWARNDFEKNFLPVGKVAPVGHAA